MGESGNEREVIRARLTLRERASIFARSFLLQAVWNPRSMQSVGFCFAVLPVLRRVAGSRRGAAAFMERHLGFFNTNPGLSTYALSSVATAELEGDSDGAAEIRRALGGPLGMAGDSLFWGAARPLAALAGVAALLMGARWAPVVMLAVYNVPHLAFRVRGISAGARGGPRGAMEVLGPRFRGLVTVVRSAACFAGGFVATLALRSDASLGPQVVVVAAAFFLLSLVALKVRVPVTAIGLAGVVGGVAIMLTRV